MLEKNEIVEGKVLKTLSKNTARLLIKGETITAKTSIPLREGQTLSLITERISPIPSFKPLGMVFAGTHQANIALILSAIKDNIWKSILENTGQLVLPEKVIPLFRKLRKNMTLPSFTRITPEFIKKLIDRSGLGWESKLRKLIAQQSKLEGRTRFDIRTRFDTRTSNTKIHSLLEGDLKGLSARLMFLDNQNGPFDNLLSVIKNIQLLNHMGLDHEKKIFLPIPMLSPEGLISVAQILIHLPKESDEEHGEDGEHTAHSSHTRIVLQMTLSRLGPIRADLVVRDREVTGTFRLSSEETRSLMEDRISSFVEGLAASGFTASPMACCLEDPEMIQRPLVTEMGQKEGGNVSLIV